MNKSAVRCKQATPGEAALYGGAMMDAGVARDGDSGVATVTRGWRDSPTREHGSLEARGPEEKAAFGHPLHRSPGRFLATICETDSCLSVAWGKLIVLYSGRFELRESDSERHDWTA